jgi:hypothetical protein
MKKYLGTLLLMIGSIFTLHGADNSAAIENARKLLLENQAACVLLASDGSIMVKENGRGISPLLTIYDSLNGKMDGTIVVDKVIGRATASIAVCGKVRHVHAEVMSRGAVDMLEKHHITASYTLLVPQILNRKRDGICPMEQTVADINDPVKALAALRIKLAELRAK